MQEIERNWLERYPAAIREGLGRAADRCPEMYAAGGVVRDLLSGRTPRDLDITVGGDAFACARLLAGFLPGTFVPLDAEEGVARVVWQEWTIDFARFREETASIEADLRQRDFTINALAIPLRWSEGRFQAAAGLLDPTGGCRDFAAGLIRPTSDRIFAADPLRLLRAYRFAATLGFAFTESLQQLIEKEKHLLARVAAERISHELQEIMASPRAAAVCSRMAADSLLGLLIPEMARGAGLAQPSSHHLDVLAHSLAALDWMERIQQEPERWFPGHGDGLRAYLEQPPRRVRLKWAALFHDLGKPATHKIREGRITFYGHDRQGVAELAAIAGRLRWSREDTRAVSRLVELHMWPFHLQNARRKTGITAKACLRLIKAVGAELPGLFLLAMADSLAGQGPGKPPEMEQSLAELYGQVEQLYRESIKPVFEQPRLLTGHDLKELFGLVPGPLIGRLLSALERAQVGGEVRNRAEAVRWIAGRLAEMGQGASRRDAGGTPPEHVEEGA